MFLTCVYSYLIFLICLFRRIDARTNGFCIVTYQAWATSSIKIVVVLELTQQTHQVHTIQFFSYNMYIIQWWNNIITLIMPTKVYDRYSKTLINCTVLLSLLQSVLSQIDRCFLKFSETVRLIWGNRCQFKTAIDKKGG